MRFVTVTSRNYDQICAELGLDFYDGFMMLGSKIEDGVRGVIIEMETYHRKADALIESRRAKLQSQIDEHYRNGVAQMWLEPYSSANTVENLLYAISETRKFYRPVNRADAPKIEMVNSGSYTIAPYPIVYQAREFTDPGEES